MVTLALGIVLVTGDAGAESTEIEPDYVFEGWFSRVRPDPPVIPAPSGDVSPGQVIPSPQATDGSYVVSSLGGQAGDGDGEGDNAWFAIQWDTFEAFDATVDEFVATFHKSPTARGDAGSPVIQACNVVAGWGAAEGANAWEGRPTINCDEAVAAEIDGSAITFDLTGLAQTWVDGTGFGVAIVPGDATNPDAELTPFQISLGGYDHPDANAHPEVLFRFTTSESLDDFGLTDFGPVGEIDIFPDDVGSSDDPFTGPIDVAPPGADAPAPDVPGASDGGPVALQPVAADRPGVPWAVVTLFLILGAVAFWSTGTALGPAGDPAMARPGRLDQILSGRQSETRS
jgi:hypothetical protein